MANRVILRAAIVCLYAGFLVACATPLPSVSDADIAMRVVDADSVILEHECVDSEVTLEFRTAMQDMLRSFGLALVTSSEDALRVNACIGKPEASKTQYDYHWVKYGVITDKTVVKYESRYDGSMSIRFPDLHYITGGFGTGHATGGGYVSTTMLQRDAFRNLIGQICTTLIGWFPERSAVVAATHPNKTVSWACLEGIYNPQRQHRVATEVIESASATSERKSVAAEILAKRD